MTTSVRPVTTCTFSSIWELRPFVSIILNNFKTAAIQREVLLINDIPEDICIDANKEMLASVLKELIAVVIEPAENSCIQITAKVYTNVILLHLKDHNSIHSLAIERKLESLAERMGGVVTVSSLRKKLATVAFSFPNLPIAA